MHPISSSVGFLGTKLHSYSAQIRDSSLEWMESPGMKTSNYQCLNIHINLVHCDV